MRHTFHHVAIARYEVHGVVDDLLVAIENGTKVCFTDCHPDGVANALTQRAGRRLHTRCVAELRMARRLALPLPELLQVIQGEIVTSQVKHAVQQHGCMASREHEAIAVDPAGIGRVVAQVLRPQHIGERGERHRRSRVPRVRFLDGVHGEYSDRVDAEVFDGLTRCGRRGRGS